jgi:uncharacterized membrane protein
MTEPQTPSVSGGSAPDLRVLTHAAYGLIALGFVTAGALGVATLAGVVLIYIKRADAAGTFYAAHFEWLLGTFWWSALWLALGAIATAVYLGWLGVLAALVWALYRLIKGWLALMEGAPPSV